jgi:hypothetical protein
LRDRKPSRVEGHTEVGIIVGKVSRRSRWFLPEEVSRVCCWF